MCPSGLTKAVNMDSHSRSHEHDSGDADEPQDAIALVILICLELLHLILLPLSNHSCKSTTLDFMLLPQALRLGELQ